MFWDGTKWATPHAPNDPKVSHHRPRRRFTASVAITAACLALAALVVPLVGVSGSTSKVLVQTWRTSYRVATLTEGSPRITYGGTWSLAAGRGYAGGHVMSTTHKGASATIAFTGTGIAWVGPTGPTRGKATVYIDGKVSKVVDTHASRFHASVVLFKRTLATPGSHTLKIVVAGTSGHATVAIDQIVVRGLTRVAIKPASTTPKPAPKPTPKPTAKPAATPKPAGSGVAVPSSIDATGANDVTSALNSFIAGVPNGSTILFKAGGDYKVNGQVHLAGRVGITLDGQGARIFRTARSTVPLLIVDSGGSNFHVLRLTIEGYHPEGGTANAFVRQYESSHGISIGGVNGVEIGPNVTVKNVGGDGVYLNQGAGHWANGVHVHDSVVESTGRAGIAITDGVRNVVVDHDTVQDTGMYAFNIEPNGIAGLDVENVRFSDNTVRRYTVATMWAPLVFAGSGFGNETNVEFSRNTVYGQPLRLVVQLNGTGSRSDFRIVNNKSDKAASGPVMTIDGVNGITITGNTQPLTSGQLAKITNSSNVQYP